MINKSTLQDVISFATLLLLASNCGPWRNSENDHSQYPYTSPVIDMTKYVSVQQRGAHQDSALALAIAISGGGYRAASFALGVLEELEIFPIENYQTHNLLKEVDYFSTVSGGGFVIAAYMSSLYDHIHGPDSARTFRFSKSITTGLPKALRKEYYSSAVPEIFRYKIGAKKFATALDTTLLQVGSPKRSLKLSDIFIPITTSESPSLPYWVTNSTVYSNGAIFPFTPDILEEYEIKPSTNISGNCELQDYYEIPLAIGVAASAAFPLLVRPLQLVVDSEKDPENPYLYLGDGGMADNLGVLSALELLQQDKIAKKKVLIIIDAYNGIFLPTSNLEKPPSVIQSSWRAGSIYLDGNHSRLSEWINEWAARDSIDVIHLDFGGLLPSLKDTLNAIETKIDDFGDNLVLDPSSQKAYDFEVNLLAEFRSIDTLYKEAYSEGTWLHIDEERQTTLRMVGWKLVNLNAQLIREILPKK